MNTNEDLTTLRASVAELDEDEKLALAGFLSLGCTPVLTFQYFITHYKVFEILKAVFEVTAKFDRAAKLSFAKELIEFSQDADDNALDEPCDGYPQYWDEDCG